MVKEKIEIEVGNIKPVYDIIGYEVCRITSDKEEEIEWIPVEKRSEAEILSFIFQQQKTVKGNKKTKEAKQEIKEEDL